MTFRTRFAPSPTGPLHLGHAYSAWLAHGMARGADGTFLLRIEDIDLSRARANWEAQIYDDLRWFGFDWETPVMRQSERHAAYADALDKLWVQGLLYPCTCTRADIAASASAPQEGAPTFGPDGVIYPGTCRNRPLPSIRPQGVALRLNLSKAVKNAPNLTFRETGCAPTLHTLDLERMPQTVGDIVLARRDMGTSYHLSVVVDDAAQNISHVVRGKDLFEATQIHVLLQHLLEVPTPVYHHHELVRDDRGKRLAKRDDARAITLYRHEGLTPQDVLSKSMP